MSPITIVNSSDFSATNPITSEHAPLTTMDAAAVRVRPQRSASTPAAQHPIAPTPMHANAASAALLVKLARSAGVEGVPRARIIASPKNTAHHVHIAYSSHMCPKYPSVARRTPRFANSRSPSRGLNTARGKGNGPSCATNAASSPPARVSAEVAIRFFFFFWGAQQHRIARHGVARSA